jgi:putative endopeptidase
MIEQTIAHYRIAFLPRNAEAYALLFLALSPLTAYSQDAPAPETHGIVVANMDRSVKPGDDFYHYANGDWIKRTEIPPDSGYVAVGGWSSDKSTELTRKQTAGLIEEAVKANAPPGSNTRKIADFYRSFMDEAAVEAKGIAPLRPHLCVRTSTQLPPSATSTTLHELWVKPSGRMSIP